MSFMKNTTLPGLSWMRLNRLAMLALILAFAGWGHGNPIAIAPTHRAYISAEKLNVQVTLDAAEVEGVFRFQSAMPKDDLWNKTDIRIEVPIWMPSPVNEKGPLARLFSQAHPHPIDHEAWQAAVGFKFRIGKLDVSPQSSIIYKPSEIRPEWRREGFFCMIFVVMVPPKVLDAETIISYRQPLRRSSSSAEFFYVPTFDNLPSDASTADIQQYSMHLKNASGSILSFGETKIAAGYSAVLPLAHHKPVVFQVSAK